MNHRPALRVIIALAVGLALNDAAQAQSFRTYLSSTGTANPNCTLAAPCRLLPEALAAVADGGEVWMLDSANYNTGPVNVTKSVTILAVPGALGSVVALGGNAIDVATAGAKVALRNLVIVPYPGGGGTGGVNMTAGASLTVDKCLIANLAGTGVNVTANAAAVLVADSVIKANLGHGLNVGNGALATVSRSTFSGHVGGSSVAVQGSAGTTTTADVTDSTLVASYNGIYVTSSGSTAVVKASVRNTQIVRNSTYGAIAFGVAATLSVSNNIVSNNTTGIAALSSAKVLASGNTVSDNATGLYSAIGGVLESASDNAVRNNGTDISGAITGIPKL